jgi:hypothetical protein
MACIAYSYLILTLLALSYSCFLVNLEALFYLGSGFNSGSSGFGLGFDRLLSLSTSIGRGGRAGFISGSGCASIARGLTVGNHFGLSGSAGADDLLDLTDDWVFFNMMSTGVEFVYPAYSSCKVV